MANQEETIRQLRKVFVSEWAHLFPLTPTPPVRALSSLRESEGQTGLSFDEWLNSGAVEQLTSAVESTRQKISQLQDQLARKTYLYEFLFKVLQCVGEETQTDPKLVPVSLSARSSARDLNVTAIGAGGSVSVSGGGTHQQQHCSISAQTLGEGNNHKQDLDQKNSRTDINFCQSCNNVKRETTLTTGTVKQTTVLPRPATGDILESVSPSQRGLGTHNIGKGTTQRVEYQRPYKAAQKDSSECTVEVDRSVCVGGQGKVDTGERNSQRQCAVVTKDDPKNQSPITKQKGETTLTAALDRHEYSSQRGNPSLPVTRSLPRTLQTGERVTAQVDSITCATQTDISFGVKEHWVVSSTHEDSDPEMFRNRKKTGGKRSEEARDRDNSGILGRHSDVPDLPVPPPVGCRSVPNVQYLKLTDGFSIVLGSDGHRRKDTDDCAASSGEESYDNNTSKPEYPRKSSLPVGAEAGRTGGRQVTPGSDGKQDGEDSSGRVINPVKNVGPAGSPSSLIHATVSRASSDTTGLRPSPSRHSPPLPPRSRKPLPTPRKKPPPLPASKPATGKPKPVFYVDCDTDDDPDNVVHSRKEGTTAAPLPSQKDSTREGRGRGECSDSSTRTCLDSGRGPFTDSPRAVHTRPSDEDAHAFETQSGFATNFTSSSCRTDQFVHNLQTTRTTDQQSPHRARDPRVPTTAPPLSTASPVQHRKGLRQGYREDQTATQQPAADSSSQLPSQQLRARIQCERFQFGIPNSSEASQRSDITSNAGCNTSSVNTSEDSDSFQSDEMFSLKRQKNTLSASSGQVAGGSPGVYRKNIPVDSAPDKPDQVTQPHLTSASGIDTAPTPSYQETDIDAAETTESHDDNDPAPPLPPKKRPKQNTYENWTIDRIMTRKVDNSEEEDDDDDTDSTPSPENTLKRQDSPSGSKDSGLCLVVQGSTAGVPEVTVSDAGSGKSGGGKGEEGEWKPIGERINSIDELNQLQLDDDDDDDDDYATLSFRREDDGGDQEDNISIASDIVFIRGPGSQVAAGSESPGEDNHQRDSMSLLHPHAHGTHTPQSTSEDEQDSPPSADTSYDNDDADGLEAAVTNSPRDNMLKMRHLLVTSILETEKNYLEHLDILIHYKRTLEASCKTSQPVICKEDIKAIFSNLQKLQEIHKEFVESLQAKVDSWSPEQTVGDIFKWLVVMFPESGKYAENYPIAVATIQRCCQESQRFQELAEQIVMTSTLGQREQPNLEGALFKPVQRMQRNTLVLYDLIKHTPEDHADHEVLQKALSLSQLNLENFGTAVVPSKVEEKRTLVKSSFLVELVSGWRKLRFIFLFSDLLVCTKMEHHRSGKVTFDCKWFIPMNALSLVTKRGYEDDMKFSKKDDIGELKKKLRGLKQELKIETKKEENKDQKHWSGISGIATSRHIEKLKKKIKELERELILSSPKLPFKVWCDSVKPHTLLMTTDYEREEWREVLTSLRRRSLRMESIPPSAYDVQEIVNSVKELPEVNKVGSMLAETDEEAIYGTLNVTIHKLNGLKDACDTYCCLEMDSLGHFFMKARTHICSNSVDPSWDEDFELELEGSQTLRILCYRKLPDKHGDLLLGRGALEMSKQWLKGSFQEKTVAMNEYSLVLSVRYTAAEQTMRRTPSRHNHAVFGVKISTCSKREGKPVPTIVTTCVQEVEKRGMDEMGIYRVSGTSSEVQKIKKHFDKSVKVGVNTVSDLPVHSVTGALKLYLRELPDPLFTEASYANFLDALKLSDAEGQEKCMLSLFHGLPSTNYYTAVYLLEHLHRVSKMEKENKMSIHNLSTIFGPTLLAPAIKETDATMTDMMSFGTEQVMKQSAVVYYFLNFLVKGGNLRKSSQT